MLPLGGRGSDDLARIIVRGGGWSFAISATGAALSRGVHLVLARILGADAYGRYVFALAWMNVLVLVGKFELDTASIRFVGAYSGTQQWSFLRGFLQRSSQIVGGMSIAITFVSALVILAFMLQGLKHVAWAQLPSLVVRPVAFVLGILALGYVLDGAVTAPVAILLQLGATTVALLLTLRFLRTVLPEPARQAREAFDTRYWMKTAGGLLVIAGAQVILSTSTDVLVVGTLLGAGAAGRYGAASQLASAVSFGVYAISFIALPVIADLYANQAFPQLQQLIRYVARLGLLLSVPVLLILIVAAGPALSAFGPSFSDASALLILLGFD
jgi:O-antigen/teichoic acid export membrane protein